MKPLPEQPATPYPARFLALSGFILAINYGLVSRLIWQNRFIGADAYNYWLDSLAWQTPFNRFHVPLYPLLLAIGRALSPSELPPLALMMGIVGVFFVVTLGLVYQLIRTAGARPAYAMWGMLLFGIWPFVGLTYVANPVADLVAITWYLAALLALLRGRLLWTALWLALALVTHKVMWFFALALIWVWLRQRPRAPAKYLLLAGMILLSPLTMLWLAGARYHNSAVWLLSANLSEEFSSRSTLPILDGLVGTALSGNWLSVIKVMLVLGVLCLAGWLIYWSVIGRQPDKQPFRQCALAISIPLIVLALLVNQKELLVIMRFSRLLVIPLVWLWIAPPPRLPIGARYRRPIGAAIILLLVMSQLVFTWHMLGRFS